MPNTAIQSDYLTPGVFVRVNFNQGQSNAGGGSRDAIYVGAQLASGSTATVNTRYEITGHAMAKTLFGEKAPLTWALKSHFKCSRAGTVYAIPYAASTGSGLVSATATITYANAATANITTKVRMFGEDRVVGIFSGDSVTTIATNVAGAINSMGWPVTATSSVGVVTVTAPIGGVSQNGIYRIAASIDSGGATTVATSGSTLGTGTGTAGVDGATLTELANLDTALDTIINEPEYYIAVCHKQNATAYGHLKTHVLNKLSANLSNRCAGFIAGTDAKATLQTSAIAINETRVSLIGEPSSEYDPAWLTGQVVAWVQAAERQDIAANMTNGYNPDQNASWHLQPIKDITARMSANDINDMIHDGITPIWSKGAKSVLAMSLTTRSKDSGGTIDDFRSTSSHIRSIGDNCADRIESKAAVAYAGYKLRADTYDGDTLTTRASPGVVTPSQFKANIMGRVIDEMDDENLLDEVDTVIIPSLWCDIDSQNVRRLEGTLDLRGISILCQVGVEINEVTPG